MSVESKELTQLCWNDLDSYNALMATKGKIIGVSLTIVTIVRKMAVNTNHLMGAVTFSQRDMLESALELYDKIQGEN